MQTAGCRSQISDRLIRPHRRLFFLLAAAAVLCFYGLMWGLPNLYDFAQDSVAPMGNLAEMGASFADVTAHRYPPLHFLLLRAAFVPARAALALPGFADNLKVSATVFILTARLVSLGMALGAVALIYLIGRRLWDERAGLLAGALFILSVTLYYAKNANLDMPCAFWLAWTLLAYARILQEDRPRDYLWLGLLAALAVCTKDQAYAFLLALPAPLMLKLRGTPGAWRKLGVAAAAFIVPFVLIHNIIFDPRSFWLHVQTILGPASAPWQECSRGAAGQARLLAESVLRLMDAWTAAGVALAAIGLAAGLRGPEARTRRAVALPALVYHAAFIGVVGYVYPRFMLPAMVALAPFAGFGAWRLWNWRGRLGRVVTVAAVGWIALAGLALDSVMSDYARYDAQRWMETRLSPETRIRYMGDPRDMPRFNAPLDPHVMDATPDALAAERPDVLVLSFGPGDPAGGSECWRLSSILRRHLGDWGRLRPVVGHNAFMEKLVAGGMGYTVAARFRSPLAPFVPEVSESVNRTILIMKRASP